MARPDYVARQKAIAASLHVPPHFDAPAEIERRVAFLADYLRGAGLRGYVLGISGGGDSSAAGRLAQLAVERLRGDGYDAHFAAVRLPYGVQHDEDDAQRALAFIRPDEITKYGDGGADILPLAGLVKRRVRALARALGADDTIVMKTPTADLETLRPQLPDEHAYGITYEQIDDFLEGKPVDDLVYETVFRFFDATLHKRALPYTPFDRLDDYP